MESKLKLAFKKIFEKNLSKEKYAGNENLAAQDALAQVKQMKGASDYNLFLYKYKGEIRGLKVFAKSLSKKKKQGKEGPEIEPEPEPELKTEPNPEPDPEPKPEPEPDPEPQEGPTFGEDADDDKIKEFVKMMMEAMQSNEAMEPPEEPEVEEEVKEEVIEKPKKRGRPSKREPPINNKEIVSPKPVKIKEVKPARPRKIPPGLHQKFQISSLKFDHDEGALPAEKRKRDYRNNKTDRIKAFQGLMF